MTKRSRPFRLRDAVLPLAVALPMFVAIVAGPAHAQQPNGPAAQAIQKACGADIQKLCAGVQPGGGRIMQCMKQHETQLSDGCTSTLTSLKAQRGQ